MPNEVLKEWSLVVAYFKKFLVNPIKEIRHLPDWHWQTNLFLCGLFAVISGSLNGLVSGNFLSILFGFLISPLVITLSFLVISGFFYYFFLFVMGRQLDYKQVFTLMVFANLPFLALNIISPLASPISLIGVAASGILLIVGFVDYFMLPKKPVVRLVIALFAVHLVMWVWSTIQTTQHRKIDSSTTTRENLDILEKELKGK